MIFLQKIMLDMETVEKSVAKLRLISDKIVVAMLEIVGAVKEVVARSL